MTTILGLTCISEQLKDKDKKEYSFRTMTRKRFNDLCNNEGRDEAIKELSNRILHNVVVTESIVYHCAKSNIGQLVKRNLQSFIGNERKKSRAKTIMPDI